VVVVVVVAMLVTPLLAAVTVVVVLVVVQILHVHSPIHHSNSYDVVCTLVAVCLRVYATTATR
jgi:hypothetical protein